MSKTQELYLHSNQQIPGAVQLPSKRPEQFAPGLAGQRGKRKGLRGSGFGRQTLLTTNGIGACLLGYADPDVTRTVVSRVESGS